MSTTIGVGRGEAIAGAGSAAPARAIPVPSAARRNAGLDALRAALTLLVLFHPTAITYGAMIAGYFTPAAAERHGAWAFLRERALRLGVPILAFSLFIGPLAIVLAQSVNPASAAAVAQSVKGLALGERLLLYWHLGLFGVGPLWFTAALLVFSFVYVAWRALASRLPTLRRPAATRAFPSNITVAAAALATGAAAFALRLVWPLGVESFGPAFGYFSTDCLGRHPRSAAPAAAIDRAPRRTRFSGRPDLDPRSASRSRRDDRAKQVSSPSAYVHRALHVPRRRAHTSL